MATDTITINPEERNTLEAVSIEHVIEIVVELGQTLDLIA